MLLSILEISKTVKYGFWCECVKSRYRKKAKLCLMDTNSFIVNIKTGDTYVETSKDAETRFDTWKCLLKRPLRKGKNKRK